ncbi:hypothetical protein EDF58_10637 [Novosphingobium sp. PhB57]|jgi:hypothetical protein|uniref:hypothetical protein n=1 Tax=unclassified Novosphingobium TaxID=2644732 RepID=UPI0010505528|nr:MULTISPECIES: hypothetical protein [unclassified Novosphingobium]TCU55751.1 hypothetical protein EDF58_10637 [Novosphingobium sp. PhB57]TDW64878.1 hypothetical protein EDF57_10351 [Novosphingobium sp. PhB55]
MTKTGATLLAALALGALVPAGAAMAQPERHPTPHHQTVVKKTTVKKTAVRKPVHKKVTCRYVVQHGRKVKVCR